MPDNALYMIHNPHAVLIDAYDAVGLSKLENELHAVKKTITNVYQKKCGDAMSAEDISRAMDEETWMGADEALTFGFIDEIDKVAFDQDELYDLLDEKVNEIYLCGDRFAIPLSVQDVSYKGINNPVVVIDSKTEVDWLAKGITLEAVRYDEKYQAVVDLSLIHI